LLTVGQAFCPTCGSAARNEYARPEWDLHYEKPTRKPKTDKTVIAWTVALLVAVILAVGIFLVVSHHSSSTSSGSAPTPYQSGYTYGKAQGDGLSLQYAAELVGYASSDVVAGSITLPPVTSNGLGVEGTPSESVFNSDFCTAVNGGGQNWVNGCVAGANSWNLPYTPVGGNSGN
jgi:hypothetical protein